MGIPITIKNLRMSLMMDKIELARELGVSITTICSYENGKRRPKLSMVRKMRDLAKKNNIEISLEEFLK